MNETESNNRKLEYKPTTSFDEACPRCGGFGIRWGRPECSTVVDGELCDIFYGRCRKCGRELKKLEYRKPDDRSLLDIIVHEEDPVAFGNSKRRGGRLRSFRRKDNPMASFRKGHADPAMQNVCIGGRCMSGKEWAEEIGIPYMTFKHRWYAGWPDEKILDPTRHTTNGYREYGPAKRHTVDGVTRTVSEWSRVSGIPAHVLYQRLRTGCTMAQALQLPYAPAKPAELFDFKGRKVSAYQLSKETGINKCTIRMRYKRGARGDDLVAPLSHPGHPGRPHRPLSADSVYLDFDGRRMSLEEWSLETGIPSDILLRRYRRRFPAEMVLAPVSQEEASRFALSNRKHRFLGLFRRC